MTKDQLKKFIVELDQENKKLRAENEKLKEENISLHLEIEDLEDDGDGDIDF